MNTGLEERIKSQVDTIRKKDLMLNQQSKYIAMGEMIGNIAHQWRQPLSAICVLASGIKMRKEMEIISDEEINNELDNIVSSTKVLSQTIDDFRDFYSSDKQKIEFEIEKTIDQVLNLVSANLRDKNIIVKKDIENIKCISYKNDLVQVLLNIINNAKDALLNINVPRYIFIKIYLEDENLIIEIFDNAGGIEENIIEQIFEPYFTTKSKLNGTGIGLYMSKNIVENNLGGTLVVQNYNFTENGTQYIGAKFKLAFPKVIFCSI